MTRRNDHGDYDCYERHTENDETNRKDNKQLKRPNAKKSDHHSSPTHVERCGILNELQDGSTSPDDRLREIAAILARGVLRIQRLPATETATESDSPSLDVSDETVLSVTRG